MNEKNYWQRIRKQQLSRRRLLRAGGRAGLGAAGLALIGCGDDDEQQAVAQQRQQQQQQQAMAQQQDQQQQQQAMAQQQDQQEQDQPQAQQQQQDQPQQQQQQEQQQTAAAAPADDARRGGVLRIGSDIGLSTYRAPYLSSSAHIPLYIPFWDTLTKYSPDGLDPQPHLAESWELNDDQTMLQIKLRPGLEFHNGKPLNATEVKRSLEAMDDEGVANNQVKGIMTKYVSAVDVIDDVTLQLHLAWGGTLVYDVLNYAQIHDVDDIPNLDGYSSLNGSGPFKFDASSYQVDQYAAGERFENFYDPALLDGIEQYQFPDATAMSLALGAGEIDLTNRLPKPDYERFNSDPDFTVVVAPPTLAIWVLGMVIPNENGGHPAFADPKVRQALYRCIDRERVANETFEGLALPKNILWPPFSPGYDEARDRDYFDPEEAARLLEEAGYGPGELTIELGHGGGEANEIAQVIQAGAAEAGINLNIQLYEPAVARDRFLNAKHESYLSSYAFFALHPQTLPVMNFQMRIPNSCAFGPDYYQALIDSFGTAESDAQRNELLEEFNTLLDNEPWIAPIVTRSDIWAWSSKFTGIEFDVLSIPSMQRIHQV